MAIARLLPVYEDTYGLVKEIMLVHKQMENIYKPTLGHLLLDNALSLFGSIEMANRTTKEGQRIYHQEQFLCRFETIRTLLRLCYDFRVINEKKQAHLCRIMDSIGKQMTAWKNR